MIVTRRRRRRLRLGRYALPLLALAALAFALWWPPSHNAIANGPLKPVWTAGGSALGVAAKPLSFAAQQQTIVDRNREIRSLNGQLEQSRQAQAADDARVAAAQQQVQQMLAQPHPTPAVAVHPSGVTGTVTTSQVAGAAAPPSDEEKRLAAAWGAMDPDKVSAIAQRLPVAEVTRILGAMDPDDAAEVLNALPPKLGAQVSAAYAQVSEASRR
jgi:hypothetical protein